LTKANRYTHVFVNWLEAYPEECMKALFQFQVLPPSEAKTNFIQRLLMELWDRQRNESAFRLIIYGMFAIDFHSAIDHLFKYQDPPSPSSPSDFIRNFRRSEGAREFMRIVRSRDLSRIEQLVVDSVASLTQPDFLISGMLVWAIYF
jgi:hypothetical protein